MGLFIILIVFSLYIAYKIYDSKATQKMQLLFNNTMQQTLISFGENPPNSISSDLRLQKNELSYGTISCSKKELKVIGKHYRYTNTCIKVGKGLLSYSVGGYIKTIPDK